MNIASMAVRPVKNQLRPEPVKTGLVTTKDRKRPVCRGSVRFFAVSGIGRTGYGYGLRHWAPKDQTGPDFQTLLGVELDSFSLFGFGNGETDDDRDNTAESSRFGNLSVSALGDDGLKLPERDLTLILVRRLGSLCFLVLDSCFLARGV
jgi:hypothetical protein